MSGEIIRYYRREWLEARGDEYNSWGTAIYYFAVDHNSYAIAQMEIYQNGQVLKYDSSHPADQYGAIADQQLDKVMVELYEIEEATFWQTWQNVKAINF